ncbi:MAG TPA: choice-of-anchor Q domain-containing protein [Dokdonella sp.]
MIRNVEPKPAPRPRVARRALAAALAVALTAGAAASARAAVRTDQGVRPHALRSVDPAQRRVLAAGPAAPLGREPIPVYNCNDDGVGSLRAAVASATSGDTVDAVGLHCGTITLSSGAIAIGVDDLAILGPGPGDLDITNGAKYGRVFTHTGTGTLRLLGMTISSGVVSPNALEADTRGGCVFSAGSLALGNALDPTDAAQGVVVRDCAAISNQSDVSADGGGLYAGDSLSLAATVVSGCRAVAQDGARSAHGGGVSVHGSTLSMKYSEVRDSEATGPLGFSGGVDAAFVDTVTVTHSTIAGNYASERAGGAYLGSGSGGRVSIDNTTISGNASPGESGLIVNVISGATPGRIRLASSTISANESPGPYGAVLLAGPTELDATIVSGNQSEWVDLTLQSAATATGADNLIGTYSGEPPPQGLIVSTDPGLAPLAYNGGPTRTHALLPGSAAIDAGDTLFDSNTDQRGFARVVGAAADIGAYERDPERIFADGFD